MDKAVIFSVGSAFMLGFGGGLFQAVTLRASIHREWVDRKDRCFVGLDESALTALYSIHAQVSRYLEPGKEFWPKGPPLDPATLKNLVDDFSRALRWKSRMQLDIERLLRIGPLLVVAFTLGIVAVGLVFLSQAWTPQNGMLAVVGYALFATTLIVLAGIYGCYVFFRHRLASTEILASESAKIHA